jgi:GxxExxY protein
MVRDEAYFKSITEQIIGCAYKVANCLGVGFLERVYENALSYELQKVGLKVNQQAPVSVNYEGIVVGQYYADLLVQDDVIVELKAVKSLDPNHFSQCMNYLKASGKKVCLLINFGAQKIEIKRIVN